VLLVGCWLLSARLESLRFVAVAAAVVVVVGLK